MAAERPPAEAAPGEAAPGEAAPGEAAPGEAASREVMAREAVPRQAASREAMAREAASREAVAREAMPRGTAPPESARRLFFALWPDGAMREAMARATREAVRASGGRPVPADNLHVTLAFLGSVPERRLPQLAMIARAAAEAAHGASEEMLGSAGPAGGALELAFDRLEHWRAAHLLCALPAEPPSPVTALARTLQDLLAAGGFAPDLKPFRPHVTVVRKVARPAGAGNMSAVVWRFTELALVESRTLPRGALYSVVESYSLCSGR